MSDDSKQREPYFEQPQDTEQPHFTVGRRLREARETYDLDLREVASQLRIRPFYLEAIEETRYQDLPEVLAYLSEVRADVVEHGALFLPEEGGEGPGVDEPRFTPEVLMHPVPPQVRHSGISVKNCVTNTFARSPAASLMSTFHQRCS